MLSLGGSTYPKENEILQIMSDIRLKAMANKESQRIFGVVLEFSTYLPHC